MATAPQGEVLLQRASRDPNHATVSLRTAAGTASSGLSISSSADIVSIEEPSASSGFVALRIDQGDRTTFAIFSTRGRPVYMGALGPVASDEENRPSLEASTTSDGKTQLAIGVVIPDSCGRVVSRIGARTLDFARARLVEVARTEASPSRSLAPAAVGASTTRPLRITSVVGSRGLITSGLERLVDGSTSSVFSASADDGSIVIRGRSTLHPLRARGLRVHLRAGSPGPLVIGIGEDRASVAPVGEGFDVVFTSPRELRCVSIEVPAGSAVAELGVIPDQEDDASAAEHLVVELASEGARADAALEALVALGGASVPTLERAYADALLAERRRILRVAEQLSIATPDVLRLFVVALEGDSEELRQFALSRCALMGTRGLRVLSTAVRRGHPELALPFAERAPFASLDAVLDRLVAGESDERRILHEALLIAARRDSASVVPALRAFVESAEEPAAKAVVLSVLTGIRDVEGIPAALDRWWAQSPETEDVDVQLRWLEAIGAIEAGARTEAMRAQLASGLSSRHWMVRAAAVDAASSDPAALEALRARLGDEAPRVRISAIEALDEDSSSRRAIAELSRNDAWPSVRLAALKVVAPLEGSDPVVRAALTERSTRVRIGLLTELSRTADPRFLADAIGILERKRAPANVLVATISYVETLCAIQAEAALVALVDRQLREDKESNRSVASAAARALERLGSPESIRRARAFVDPTRGGGTPPPRCSPRAGT